jgi:hypothetical protein
VLFEIRPAVLCCLFTFILLELVLLRNVLLKLLDEGIATLFSRAELLAITAEFRAACAAKSVLRLVLIVLYYKINKMKLHRCISCFIYKKKSFL